MENWKIGKNKSVVVTDSNDGFNDSSTGHSGKEAIEYYGGNLVCESIYREKDAQLISAAPDLLEALKNARRVISKLGAFPKTIEQCDAAITKAEGR